MSTVKIFFSEILNFTHEVGFFKDLAPSLYKIYIEDEQIDDEYLIDINQIGNSHVTYWTWSKLTKLQLLITKHIPNLDDPSVQWMKKSLGPKDNSPFDIPTFHPSVDGKRFVVGMSALFGDFFYRLEHDANGPDQKNTERGNNLKALLNLANYCGNHKAVMLCAARVAQHAKNKRILNYVLPKIGGILTSTQGYNEEEELSSTDEDVFTQEPDENGSPDRKRPRAV